MNEEQKKNAKNIKRLEIGTVLFALFYVGIIAILVYCELV